MALRLSDRYRLLHPVWRDRYGMTHIAAGQDGGPAAVRVLAPAGPAVARRAAAERGLLTTIRHRNLAAVREVLTGDGVAIVTEAVVGRPLRRVAMTHDAFLRVAGGVAAGLAALHGHGVRHGTIGPSTVLVDRSGEAVLTDIAVGHLLDLPGGDEADHDALAEVLSTVWRNTHGRWRRPPGALRDVWADTMAGARDMG